MARDVTTRIGVEDRASAKLRRASQDVSKYGRAWQNTAARSQRAMAWMERGMHRLQRGVHTLWRRMRFMMLGFQITAFIMGTSMVRAALKYERALRNVTSLMAGAGMAQEQIERNFAQMDKRIRELTVSSGQAPQALAEGMYEIVSTGFEGAAALEVLEAAALSATAGLTTADVTTALLTQTLQAFRREGESQTDMARQSMTVMDKYFQAVNYGVFTFEELALKVGSVTSTASAFGITLEDLLGFLATATVRGVDLDEAITGVRQTMLGIVSLTPASERAAKDLFGADWEEKWGASALAGQGLYGVLKNLTDVLPDIPTNMIEAAIAMEDEGGDAAQFLADMLGSNIKIITDLFPNIRALKAVLAVTGPALGTYADNIDKIGQSAGATVRAQEEMAKSADMSLQFIKSAWQVFKIDMGNIVLPFIKGAADSIMKWWGGLPMKFAQNGGLFDTEMWQNIAIGPGGQEAMETAAADFWASAAPSERISFILREAWSTAMTNLRTWFESGGGKEKIEALGGWLGGAFASLLRGLSGQDAEGGVGESLPYKFGKSFIEGFTQAFEDFDWGAFFESTVGRGILAVLGGITLGPGGAVGGWLGGDLGSVVTGALVWKVLKGLTGGGGGRAAAGAAGAGGAAASTAARVAGKATFWQALAFAVAGEQALSPVIEQGFGSGQGHASGIGRRLMFGGGETDRGGKTYGYGSDDLSRQWAETQARGMAQAYPSGIESSDRVIKGASDKFEDSTRQMELAVATFGSWVLALPMVDQIGLGRAVQSSGSGGRRVERNAIGSTGTVYKPTLFMAGEAGPEDFTFKPRRNQGGGGGGGGNVIISPGAIVVQESSDPKLTAAYIVRELEKAVSNG